MPLLRLLGSERSEAGQIAGRLGRYGAIWSRWLAVSARKKREDDRATVVKAGVRPSPRPEIVLPDPCQAPHPVDLHVGARLRLRRRLQRLSQGALAAAVGVTAQQIQKYERGGNRISASMLVALGAALQTPAGFFFEGWPGQDGQDRAEASGRAGQIERFLTVADGMEWLDAVSRIPSPAVRRRLLALTCAIADGPDEAQE